VSEGMRFATAQAVLAATLSFGPSVVPPWRTDQAPPPAATLEVGEPMPWIFRTRLCTICRSREDR
jgi:hypothetical protein